MIVVETTYSKATDLYLFAIYLHLRILRSGRHFLGRRDDLR
jgi:hypothetical protein